MDKFKYSRESPVPAILMPFNCDFKVSGEPLNESFKSLP